ncbi:MAG: ArsR family transcriptional regulator [Sphingobacteriales bacterium]|nr:MAG: ArsR family transcriptional regulator [Sphingobacteriales bacterium]
MESNCIRLLADQEQIQACRIRLGSIGPSLQGMASILDLVGNEVRLKILFLLGEEQELCPCDLADILGMTVPAVSQHLRKLKDGGLVAARKDGQTIFYSIIEKNLTVLNPLFAFITPTEKLETV